MHTAKEGLVADDIDPGQHLLVRTRDDGMFHIKVAPQQFERVNGIYTLRGTLSPSYSQEVAIPTSDITSFATT